MPPICYICQYSLDSYINNNDITFITLDSPCDGNPCMHGGVCTVDDNGYSFCNCTPGWLGDDCEGMCQQVQASRP